MATRKIKGPRIRKAPPAPRTEAVKVVAKQRSGLFSLFRRTVKAVFRLLAPVFRPLAPVFRLVKKVLSWLVPRYFVNAWRELRLVTWPSRRESWRLTSAVFIFAVVFGALLTVVDKGLDDLFKKTVLK